MRSLRLLLLTCFSVATRSVPPSLPPQWYPKQPRPVDREERAVGAALAALDLCALIDLGVYDRRKAPGAAPATRRAVVRDGVRECELVRGESTVLTVRDEPPSVASLRNDGAVVDLSGVKGYQVERRAGLRRT